MSRRKDCPKQKQSFVNKEDASKVMSSKKSSPASEASSSSLESSNAFGYDLSTSIGPYNYSVPTLSQWSSQGYGMPFGPQIFLIPFHLITLPQQDLISHHPCMHSPLICSQVTTLHRLACHLNLKQAQFLLCIG